MLVYLMFSCIFSPLPDHSPSVCVFLFAVECRCHPLPSNYPSVLTVESIFIGWFFKSIRIVVCFYVARMVEYLDVLDEFCSFCMIWNLNVLDNNWLILIIFYDGCHVCRLNFIQ